MRICVVALDYPNPIPGGGVGTYVQITSRFITAHGYEVDVVALSESMRTELVYDGKIKIHLIRQPSFHWYIYKLPLLGKHLALAVRELERSFIIARTVRNLNRSKKFDLIEITETGGVFVRLMCRGVPVICRLHGDLYTAQRYTPPGKVSASVVLSRLVQRYAMRRCDLLLAVSNAHASEISRELKSRHGLIKTIPNFIDLDQYQFVDSPSDKRNKCTILFVGRLEPGKGLLLLLSSFATVLKTFPEAELQIVGSEHPSLSRNIIDRWINDLHLGESVRLLGVMDRTKLSKLYSTCTIFVSTSYYESFGIAVLEALAHGCPVVASSVGGVPEIFCEQEIGVLFESGNMDDCSSAIIQLLSDSVKREEYGEKAKMHVRERFPIDRIGAALLKTYDHVHRSNWGPRA